MMPLKMVAKFWFIGTFLSPSCFTIAYILLSRAGVSRSATVVAAYIMQTLKLPRDDALTYLARNVLNSSKYFPMNEIDGLRYIRERRSRILPNAGFYRQLGDWQSRLGIQEQLKTT